MDIILPTQLDYEPVIALLKEQKYKEAEEGAIREIRKAPLLAQGWVLLGEALMHQRFGTAAKKAFDRAWLLDPEADWVLSVYKALQHTPLGPERHDINEMLHYKKVTVTIGIIVRDEERSIRRCLECIQGAADDIVLVDCGSQDGTLDIAAEFPNVRIVQVEWNNDFAALRNAGLDCMNTDWVLWIDADEYLLPEDREAVREAAGLYDEFSIPPVLYIWQMNEVNGAVLHEYSQTRMFPLRCGLKYHGRVHEQVVPADGDMFSVPSYRKPVRIRVRHDGYQPERVKDKDKLSRNLTLLEMMVREEPDNPGWWMFYARESLASGLVDQALEGLAQAERTAADKPAFARMLDVYMLMVKISSMRGEWSKVEEICEQALALHPNFPDAEFYSAMAKLKRANVLYRDAERQLRKAKEDFKTYRGTVSPDHEIAKWKADASIADIARSVGKFGDAAHIYKSIADRYPYVKQMEKPLRLLLEQAGKLSRVLPVKGTSAEEQ
jgi:glycosyltransferase involved in cell wall biosynthesis